MVVGEKPAKEAEIRFFPSGLYKANIKPFRVIPGYCPHMSEFNRGMPEGVTPKATIINFEAAKEKRLEEKTGRQMGYKRVDNSRLNLLYLVS